MPMVIFKRGSKGPTVREIQQRLNILAGYAMSPMGNGSSQYPPLDEDGKYGKKTSDRVKEFQMWNPPLKVDGKVGPNTWGKLTGKFWSPEVAKAAAMEAVTKAIEVATPKAGYLYALSAPDFKAARASGNHKRKADHPEDMITRVYIEPHEFPTMGMMLAEAAKEENISISGMVLALHSDGAGTLFIGNYKTSLEPKVEAFFGGIKDRLVRGSVIDIYACSFATSIKQRIVTDHDIVWDDEMTEGPGIRAMQKLARYTGCEVRASFGYKYIPNFNGFEHPWASVKPDGSWAIHMEGRKLADWEIKGQRTEKVRAVFNRVKLWMEDHGM